VKLDVAVCDGQQCAWRFVRKDSGIITIVMSDYAVAAFG
jgi:hypothetical protein